MRAADLPGFAVRVDVLDPEGVAVRVEGEVDIDTAGRIGGMVDEALSDGHRDVQIDLRQVGFLDPSGIATLLACRRAVEARHGTMRTVCTVGPVCDILVLTGVEAELGVEVAARP